MKKEILLKVIAIAPFCFLACSKMTCITPSIFFGLSSVDSADTQTNFVQYRKGGSFADSLKSFNNNPLLSGTGIMKTMVFPQQGADIYDYDWKVTLIPSGRTYKITKLAHGNSSKNVIGLGGDWESCVNSVSCNVNGKDYTVKEKNSTGSSAQSAEVHIEIQ